MRDKKLPMTKIDFMSLAPPDEDSTPEDDKVSQKRFRALMEAHCRTMDFLEETFEDIPSALWALAFVVAGLHADMYEGDEKEMRKEVREWSRILEDTAVELMLDLQRNLSLGDEGERDDTDCQDS